jgi:hypothetical protein
MRMALKIILGLLAGIGFVSLSLWIFAWTGQFCERQVLARAVSPSGALAAEHYRARCDDDRPDEYSPCTTVTSIWPAVLFWASRLPRWCRFGRLLLSYAPFHAYAPFHG